MAIRLSGIASGLDTDAMVQELVSAYSLKQESYEKQKTKLEWKQEVWKDLNKSIYSFYTTAGYILFCHAHETFSKIDHMVDHKTSFNKFKRNEIIQNMLFDNNGTKLKSSNKGNVENSQMSAN